MRMKRPSPVSALVFCAAGIVLLWAAAQWGYPHISDAMYRREGSEQATHSELPILWRMENVKARYDMTVAVELHRPLAGLHLTADDCIYSLSINGDTPRVYKPPRCGQSLLRPSEGHDYFEPGRHVLTLEIENRGGMTGLRIRVPPKDGFRVVFTITLFAFIALAGTLLAWSMGARQRVLRLSAIASAGIALRFCYFLATPYPQRSYDSWGHIEYIRYMVMNGAIPPSEGGWEFHQNPLYYTLMSALWRIGKALGLHDNTLISGTLAYSFVCSSLILVLGIVLLHRTFPKKLTTHVFLAAGILATLPVLIFQSAQMTNDTMSMLLGLGAVVQLTRMKKNPETRDWIVLGCITAAAILTKASYLFLFPLIFGYIVLQKKDWQWKMKSFFIVLGTVLLLSSWLIVIRATEEEHARLVSFGSEYMPAAAGVGNGPWNYLTFHPGYMLQQPFNSPWSDSLRRQYFPEYTFRSVFFGEFQFRQVFVIANGILFLALLVLPAMLIAAVRDGMRIFKQPSVMLLTGISFAAALILYRMHYPFSSNQDVRLSPLMLIPAAYYAGLALDLIPEHAKSVYVFIIAALCGLCAAFITSLMFL